MLAFQYHPDILTDFPAVVGGVLLVRDLQNGATPDPLRSIYLTEQESVRAKIGNTPLSELESLAAWRAAFRNFGVNPTKYRSAVEALLRRLTKKGDIPSINTLVDICNLVSIRYQLPVAAFDVRSVRCPITVCYAQGTEMFYPLGVTEAEHPEAGEVIFADEDQLVVARRWCWRQSNESAAREDTTAAIFTIESQHDGGKSSVESALADLDELLNDYAEAGERIKGVLTNERAKISY